VLKFKSVIDGVFKNEGKYLIVNWKTDKDEYLKNIMIAIDYIGLRDTINRVKLIRA